MSDKPRMLQAADVYNATHDLKLYEWVASLESQNQALQKENERLHKAYGRLVERLRLVTPRSLMEVSDEALSPTQETDPNLIGEPGVDWVDADHPCKRCGQMMPHTHDLRPTQETDPE